jgi:predicted small secreted protein
MDPVLKDKGAVLKDKGEFAKMIRKVLLAVVLIVMLFSLVSCQTVQGIGADIQWIGEKGEETIER